MSIINNSFAMIALKENNKNYEQMNKTMKKISSGMKLNEAGDSAADYSISERMRTLIRSLDQDISNAQKGIDIVKTVEDGINNIIDNLRNMKEMAINSSNDHNTDIDRKILQKEFKSRMETIDDIASNTNYNGKVLMDGRYWYKEYETFSCDDTKISISQSKRNTEVKSNSLQNKKMNKLFSFSLNGTKDQIENMIFNPSDAMI